MLIWLALKSAVWVAGERHGKKDPVVQAKRALKITCGYMQLFLVPLILTFSQLIPAECLVLKHLRIAKSERRFQLEIGRASCRERV